MHNRRAPLLALALILTLASIGHSPAAPSLTIGPYVQNVGTDSATICWATSRGEVHVAPTADPASTATTTRTYDHHAVTLRDLKPNTTYTYDVLGDGGDLGKATFTTFAQGEHPFSFIVVGDTQGRQDLHRTYVERIIAERPDMVFNTGDLTDNGRNLSLWETFFAVNHDLMRTTPYYPAIGNHEKDSHFYFDFFSLPGNERYYSFDRGAAHFVVMDSVGPLTALYDPSLTAAERTRFMQYRDEYWRTQLAWLREDVAARRDAKYVFVFFHYPPFSVQSRTLDEVKDMRNRLGNVMQELGVSAVFNGHDHDYYRVVSGGVQFIDGGFGAGNPREIDAPQPDTVKYARVISYERVEVGAERATVTVTTIDGQTVEQFDIAPRTQAAKSN